MRNNRSGGKGGQEQIESPVQLLGMFDIFVEGAEKILVSNKLGTDARMRSMRRRVAEAPFRRDARSTS